MVNGGFSTINTLSVVLGNISVNAGVYGFSAGIAPLLAWGNLAYGATSGAADATFLAADLGGAVVNTDNPTLDANHTPTTLTGVPTLGELVGVATGHNLAGALTLPGGGGGSGGGPVPMIGSPFLRRGV